MRHQNDKRLIPEQIMRRNTIEQTAICLSELGFFNGWGQWKNTVNQANKMTQKMGMSEVAFVRVRAFFAEKLCAKSIEEILLKDLWMVATPQERKTLGELLFRVMDKSTDESNSQELNEPYGGY
jgi:hypothetical protein